MTDNTSSKSGNYPDYAFDQTCILNEGAPTVSTAYDAFGQKQKVVTWASELHAGDWVAISNDKANTFVATGGLPVVEKAVDGETLLVGQIVDIPTDGKSKMPANTAAGDTWAKQLAGGFFRKARVKIYGGIVALKKATIMCNGTNATVPGVGTTIKFNITSGYANHDLQFDSVASGGVGFIPFHYVPAGTDGDTYSCLVGMTALGIAVTGA